MDAVLLRPLPFDEPERLVLAWETDRSSGTTREPASWPDFVDVKVASRSLEMLAAFTGADATLTSPEREPRPVSIVAATHDLLPLLGVEPLLGRWFDPAEDRPGGRLVADIGEDFWRTYFGASRAAIGARIELDGRAFTIAGVLPASADLGIHQVHQRAAYGSLTTPERVQIWIPLQADEASYPRTTHPNLMLGRLSDGASVDCAQRELSAIASRLEAAFPENRARGIFIEPFEDVVSVRCALRCS